MLQVVPHGLLLLFLAPLFLAVVVSSVHLGCPKTTTVNGVEWATRYYEEDCKISPKENISRGSDALDINIVVSSPYTGSLHDMVTAVEPMISMAAQEIEDSDILPGFRMKFFLVDSKCTSKAVIANAIKSLTSEPAKHGLIGDSCSESCVSVSDVVQPFNIIAITPGCVSMELSDHERHPYFLRMVPSMRLCLSASHAVLTLLELKRTGIIYGPQSINSVLQEAFVEMVSSDDYDWTILFTTQVSTSEEATAALEVAKSYDARILLNSLYDSEGVMLFCAASQLGMSPPDYLFFILSGWWNQGFMASRASGVSCTEEQVMKAAYGSILFDRGTSLDWGQHDLSGRQRGDIIEDYNTACSSFADTGLCNLEWAGYFYDTTWHFARLMHIYLIEENGTYDALASEAARQRLYDLSLAQDYQGLTGRIRQYNSVEPTTEYDSGAYGDREGNVLLRQIRRASPHEFEHIGYWQPDGEMVWMASFSWSMNDSSKVLPCSGATCDFENGWRPKDRSDSCAGGSIWTNKEGCVLCAAGTFAEVDAAQCEVCEVGKYSSEAGQTSCLPCPAGSFVRMEAAQSCNLCAPGSFSSAAGSSDCDWCPHGTYAGEEGAEVCDSCSSGLTTTNVASRSEEECTCPEGSYLSMVAGECVECGEGLSCPVGSKESTLLELLHGASAENLTSKYPTLEPKYFSNVDDPFSVYECKTEVDCPGGLPGTCSSHHQGLACAHCQTGFYKATSTTCEKCSEHLAITIAAVTLPPILAATVLALIHAVLNAPSLKASGKVLAAASMSGLMVNTMLTVSVFGSFSLIWESPLNDFFAVFRFFQFDWDILRLACLFNYNSQPAQVRYLWKLLCYPICLLLLFLGCTLMTWIPCIPSAYLRLNSVTSVNSAGFLMSICFVWLSLISLEPLRCLSNPNGKKTMLADRSQLCWEGTGHAELLAMSSFATLVYPVFFLATTCFVSLFYAKLSVTWGVRFTARFRFLAARMRPEQLVFAFFWNLKNFMVSFFPSVVSLHQFQVGSLLFLFTTWLYLQTKYQCWRFDSVNLLDSIASMMLIMVLFGFALLRAAEDEEVSSSAVGWYIVGMLSGLLALVLLWIFTWITTYLCTKARYSVFLSHHKDGAGVHARQLKCLLEGYGCTRPFLDTDELDDLDKLQFAVKSSRRFLLIFTSQVLERPWCMVEIVSAWQNRLPMVVVQINEISPEASLENCQQVYDMMSIEGVQILAQAGISREDVITTVTTVSMAPTVRLELSRMGLAIPDSVAKSLLGSDAVRYQARTYAIDDQLGYLVYDTSDDIQCCSAHVLGHFLRRNRWGVILWSAGFRCNPAQREFVRSVAIVLMSPGLVADSTALGALVLLDRGEVETITVLAGYTEFWRPSAIWLEEFRTGALTDMQGMQEVVEALSMEDVYKVVVPLYQILALRFAPDQNQSTLWGQCAAIERRAVIAAMAYQDRLTPKQRVLSQQWSRISLRFSSGDASESGSTVTCSHNPYMHAGSRDFEALNESSPSREAGSRLSWPSQSEIQSPCERIQQGPISGQMKYLSWEAAAPPIHWVEALAPPALAEADCEESEQDARSKNKVAL